MTMELKNYQEDLVLRAIEIALEDHEDLVTDRDFVNDVAAYVLNRVPPRYVMSERGFLRLALEQLEDEPQDRSLANVIELMILVNRGVEVVKGRRSAEPVPRPPRLSEEPDLATGAEYVHNYPQILGTVVDGPSGDPVYGAIVTMHLDGDVAPPADSGWPNPYVTREETRGHFSFWPHATRSDRPELVGALLFTVEHASYAPFRHVEQVATKGGYSPTRTIRGDSILSLPPFVLQPAGDSDGTGS
ncbi:MAG: late competence development ComFB family protein [Spirochaetota bacterium]